MKLFAKVGLTSSRHSIIPVSDRRRPEWIPRKARKKPSKRYWPVLYRQTQPWFCWYNTNSQHWHISPVLTLLFRFSDSSASTLSRGVDQRVAEQHFSSAAAKTNEADRSNVVGGGIRYNPPSSVFRSAVGINLIYLTVQQYVLFNSVRKAMIRAPAGAGKTKYITVKGSKRAKIWTGICSLLLDQAESTMNGFSDKIFVLFVFVYKKCFCVWYIYKDDHIYD